MCVGREKGESRRREETQHRGEWGWRELLGNSSWSTRGWGPCTHSCMESKIYRMWWLTGQSGGLSRSWATLQLSRAEGMGWDHLWAEVPQSHPRQRGWLQAPGLRTQNKPKPGPGFYQYAKDQSLGFGASHRVLVKEQGHQDLSLIQDSSWTLKPVKSPALGSCSHNLNLSCSGRRIAYLLFLNVAKDQVHPKAPKLFRLEATDS